MILHDVQGLVSEMGHDALGQPGAYALDGAGGQIAQDGGGVRRHIPLVLLHLELAAVLGIVYPASPQNEAISVGHVGEDTAGGDHVVLQTEIHYGVSVVLVGVDDMLHRALQLGEGLLGGVLAPRHGDVKGRQRGIIVHGKPPFCKMGSCGYGASSKRHTVAPYF